MSAESPWKPVLAVAASTAILLLIPLVAMEFTDEVSWGPGDFIVALPGAGIPGLMPEAAIERLLGPQLPRPSSAPRIPRAEIYLVVPDAEGCHARAVAAGAVEPSARRLRSWGHRAAYSLDLDGHVLAFATAGAGAPS